jgi:RNA recognition motif-containing protein
LDESFTKITRIKPFNVDPTRNALTPWSIYVEGLKAPYDTAEKIKELFEKVDPVHHVVLPEAWNGTKKFFGFCFIEFHVPQAVHRAVRLFNRFHADGTSKTKHKMKERSTDQDVSELGDKLELRVMTK